MRQNLDLLALGIIFILLLAGSMFGIYRVQLRDDLRNKETQKCEEYCYPYTVLSCKAKTEDFSNKNFAVLVVCSEVKQTLLLE